ncbi:hypothetical protein ABT124_03345 [Streptomyces sp. NPDC001982]|uniref:hypothetical protein n=1 Tax=Streptomyces sp. NPDC001982 TaxID=3154405 RepID=UPI003319458B
MDTLLRSLDLIEPGDLVVYHGSIEQAHGLYIAQPCDCYWCRVADKRAAKGGPDSRDPRYRLTDPWGTARTLHCARRQSITRSAACA